MKQQTQNKQLPKGWKKVRLGSNDFKIISSGIEKFEGEKDYLSTESIQGTKIGKVEAKVSYKKRHSRANMQPIINSVWFAKMKNTLKVYSFDESNKDEIGQYILSTGFAGIFSKSCITKYLKYFCLSLGFNTEKDNLSTGSTQMAINNEGISKIQITFPESKEKQQLIVSAIETQFTRLDEAVKVLKSVKDKLKIYRKAVLAKSFYGEKKTLPQIVSSDKHSMQRGPFGGSLKKEIFVPKGYKIYEQKHAINDDFDLGRYFITKEKFEEMKAFAVKPGDFIISCSGTIGKIAEIPKGAQEGIINQALLKIKLDNSKIINKYFKYVFESELIQRHLTIVSRGVAIKNVPSVKELKEIQFPVPSIEEQQEIIQEIESKFSVIDKVEEVVSQSLIKAEKLRKSILKSAFEGKLVKFEEVKSD